MTTEELDELFNSWNASTRNVKDHGYDPRAITAPLFGRGKYNDLLNKELQRSPAKKPVSLHPKSVIFNPPATIVEWDDGTKTVVKCHDDTVSEEFGFAMAVMRKIYGSRKNFMAQFKNAYRPYLKPKKAKKKAAEQVDAAERV